MLLLPLQIPTSDAGGTKPQSTKPKTIQDNNKDSGDTGSDGIQGVRTGSREPVLGMSG